MGLRGPQPTLNPTGTTPAEKTRNYRRRKADASGVVSAGYPCPVCDSEKTLVKDSRRFPAGQGLKRRRQCPKCSHRFTTIESVDVLADAKRENLIFRLLFTLGKVKEITDAMNET